MKNTQVKTLLEDARRAMASAAPDAAKHVFEIAANGRESAGPRRKSNGSRADFQAWRNRQIAVVDGIRHKYAERARSPRRRIAALNRHVNNLIADGYFDELRYLKRW